MPFNTIIIDEDKMAMLPPIDSSLLEQKPYVEWEEEQSNGQHVADEQEVVDSGLEDATTASLLKLSKNCLSKTKVCRCYKMTCSWQYRAKCHRHHVTEQSVEDTEMEQNEFDEDY